LAGQWIGTGGNSINTTNWSVGPSITGAILDGGASASKVDAATARWKIAVGVLNSEIRSAAQDIQNALADQESANARIATASIAVTAARNTMRATEAQWRAGAVSLFELEDATRQFEVNEETQIVALRDRTQAWVALIKATANAVAPSKDPT
jgi:outer membrane protein TolC